MNADQERLLSELLGPDRPDAQRAVLSEGSRVFRRRRRRRTLFRGLGIMAVAALGVLSQQTWFAPSAPGVAQGPSAPHSPTPHPPAFLTDDELLAVFADVPVGLAEVENGKKRLIFPRPGDEQRFVWGLQAVSMQ